MKIQEREMTMSFEKSGEEKLRNKNLTVPNAMSLFRILVIPFFAYFFLKDNLTAAVIGSEMCIRDRGTVAVCIAVRYPTICPLLFLLVTKELVMLCGACFLLHRGKKPCAAKWYGKVSTTLFYAAIVLIVVMDGFMQVQPEVFNLVSNIALVVTAAFMLYTFVRYFGVFREILRNADGQYDLNLPEEIRAKKQKP